MSMMQCYLCPQLIDTDDQPETYEDEADVWVCWPCRDARMREMKATYDAAPLSERNPDQYRRDMRDAGRGHLLSDE